MQRTASLEPNGYESISDDGRKGVCVCNVCVVCVLYVCVLCVCCVCCVWSTGMQGYAGRYTRMQDGTAGATGKYRAERAVYRTRSSDGTGIRWKAPLNASRFKLASPLGREALA